MLRKLKTKLAVSLILCLCLLQFNTTNAANSTGEIIQVDLTGKGIAVRLHEPVLKQFPGVNTKFVRIRDDFSLNNEQVEQSVDWLFLGTPVYKQKNHILNSLGKYKGILCEKPVGLSAKEIQDIKEHLTESNTVFRVNYALRFVPVMQEVLNFLNHNEVKSISMTCNANFNLNQGNSALWKKDQKLGGGILYSIFPHLIDTLNFLGYEFNPETVDFLSESPVPMDNIKVSGSSSGGIPMGVNIDLCQTFDELSIKIETESKIVFFDLVDQKNISQNLRYPNGTLSATSDISPWKVGFEELLKILFSNPNESKLAKIEDAEKVHKVIDAILSKVKTPESSTPILR
ncbi:Gfo/Idh/MocA family oxidoreductase [Paenibacillus popilliae]|uniref:Predicted dehydrogenase n=1 Tax=Paenibacillus popilliae ATCC 14706 TaxID=1212764 RepID=M9LGZ5_PAEPP|nr:Gfo/Idh/MocA family oxidoreductase [Paenibacillus popilliae]GAC41965.1 predicted dehydrogenase [Paenibacillus popilliae ATCC 14706]